jgi:hypothetical protein
MHFVLTAEDLGSMIIRNVGILSVRPHDVITMNTNISIAYNVTCSSVVLYGCET